MKTLPVIALVNLSESTIASLVIDLNNAAHRCMSLSGAVPTEYAEGLEKQAEALWADAKAIKDGAQALKDEDTARRAKMQAAVQRHRDLCAARR